MRLLTAASALVFAFATSAASGADGSDPEEISQGGAMAESAAAVSAGFAAASAPLLELPPPDYLDPLRLRLDQAAGFERTVGLAVAVLEQGRPVLVYTSGETAAGSGEAITPETKFRASSLSKGFTGALLALLEAEGRIDLNRAAPSSVIRLRAPRQPSWLELVTHQTGLPPNAYDNLIEAGRPAAQVRARLAEVDLICPMGQCYTYQNVAFSAAEQLIEEATGLSYAEALQHYIFEPYGLGAAGVGRDSLATTGNWARPHRGWRRAADRPGQADSHYDSMPSAAGVTVSLNDMIAWVQAHLNEEGGLPAQVRARLFTPYVASPRETRGLGAVRARVSDTYYGLGWRIYSWGGRTLITHSGYLSGYGAQIVMEPETGFAFIALWNADARAPWRLWPTVMDLRTGDGPGDWIDRIAN